MAFEATWLAARLDYEILNIPLEQIADTLGLTPGMLQEIHDEQGWKQWFPSEETEFTLDPDSDLNEGDNLFELRANQFTAEGQKRLHVYQLAKQMHLAGMYTKLEASLVEKATEAIEEVDSNEIGDIQTLASILQSLTRDLKQLSQSMTLSQDENGLPQLIIRDLSNT